MSKKRLRSWNTDTKDEHPKEDLEAKHELLGCKMKFFLEAEDGQNHPLEQWKNPSCLGYTVDDTT